MSQSVLDLILRAHVCEEIGLYDEMITVVNELVKKTKGAVALGPEERNLLSVAYKNYIGPRRSSWRTLLNIEKAEDGEISIRYENARNYRIHVEKEIKTKCMELIMMLETRLIPGVQEANSDVFYHKLKGDYNRYLAETEVDDSEKADAYIEKAKESYEGATSYAETRLSATDPLRLGLALNYSVFIHELALNQTLAIEIATNAYEDAVAEIEESKHVDEDRYHESVNLLKLLRQNLKIWTTNHRGPSLHGDQF